ncbi:MAG: hypothetical protein Q8R09_00450 [Anaerolineaceae bacterium]|nr:hypothetical protein [Anaerolineaceae bacterium]
MSYSINFNDEKRYILVTLTGEIDVPTIRTAILEAGKVILEHQCNRIIGDFRETTLLMGTMDILHLYEFWIQTLKTNKVNQHESKRAIYINPDQKNREKFRFFETIAVNRNSRVKIFYDLDKAIEWICM